MAQAHLVTRIDEEVKGAIEEVCRARGLELSRFVEDALLDKLEELADIQDLRAIRCEPTRPLSKILEDLNLNAKSRD